MSDAQERPEPPERDARDPAEATRAENEPRPTSGLFVLIVVVILAVGTVLLTQEVRRRRMARSPPAGTPEPTVDSPAALGLPSMEVAVELQSVANRIRAAWKRDDAPPASLDGLPADEEDPPGSPDSPSLRDPPLDFWGRPYRLERSETDGRPMLTLITHGSDGVPGGVGDEQDLLMEIGAPED